MNKEVAPRNYAETYLKTFFEEKDLPFVEWELTDNNGTTHIISNEVVIEAILTCSPNEQAQISLVLHRLDFQNQNINDYLKHLAGALINREGGEN